MENTIRIIANTCGATSMVPSLCGWRVTFPNGASLSVQCGPFHHCGENTAEIAAFRPKGANAYGRGENDFLWPEQVRGWQGIAGIRKAMEEVAAL